MAKQRQIMIEQRGGMAAMQAMEKKSDAELEAETKHRSAAFAILGARAAERYDADASRLWFQKALAAARPQERLALKRMADASIALAERRAGDLKIAVEKLGTEAPSGRQLFVLRLMGIIAPPKSASLVRRIGGPILLLLAIVVLIAAAAGLIFAIALPFGGIKFGEAILFGLLALAVGFGVLAVLGRRRQKQARQGL
jgi:hypothetical protein